MAGRPGRPGRKAKIDDTVLRIASGNSQRDPTATLARCAHTVELLSGLADIDYAVWQTSIEVYVPHSLVHTYRKAMNPSIAVQGRPEFPHRGDLRRWIEGLGNPGWLGMIDDDFRGFDQFPSINGCALRTDPEAVAGILCRAFTDMTDPQQLGCCGGEDFTNATTPWMWGFRVRECEDISRLQGSSGPRTSVPWLSSARPLKFDQKKQKRQPLLQNMVFIRKGAPGKYPIGMNYCEDGWRQELCRELAGDAAIGTHLAAKIDFYRSGTNAKNENNFPYQMDWKMFIDRFPNQDIMRGRSSWQ